MIGTQTIDRNHDEVRPKRRGVLSLDNGASPERSAVSLESDVDAFTGPRFEIDSRLIPPMIPVFFRECLLEHGIPVDQRAKHDGFVGFGSRDREPQ